MNQNYKKLLVVALKPEWSFLKKNFSFEKTHHSYPLYALKDFPHTALLQVGFAQEKSQKTFLEFLDGHSVSSVLHFGCSGALHNNLKNGNLTIADHFFSETENFLLQNKLTQKTQDYSQKKNIKYVKQKLYTSQSILKTSEEKTKIHQSLGCHSVDMESFEIAKICKQNKIEYCSVRSIFDELNDNLENFEQPCDETGNLQASKIAVNLIKSPKMIFQLPQMQKKAQAVNKSLFPIIKWFIEEYED